MIFVSLFIIYQFLIIISSDNVKDNYSLSKISEYVEKYHKIITTNVTEENKVLNPIDMVTVNLEIEQDKTPNTKVNIEYFEYNISYILKKTVERRIEMYTEHVVNEIFPVESRLSPHEIKMCLYISRCLDFIYVSKYTITTLDKLYQIYWTLCLVCSIYITKYCKKDEIDGNGIIQYYIDVIGINDTLKYLISNVEYKVEHFYEPTLSEQFILNIYTHVNNVSKTSFLYSSNPTEHLYNLILFFIMNLNLIY